jgi:ABC-type transport system substrate-binding protein
MRKLLLIAILAGVWKLAFADTQDFLKAKVIYFSSDLLYFDAGQNDGVTAGQNFELYSGQQVIGAGKIAWADQNISRSEPLDSVALAGLTFVEPLIAKIRLFVVQAGHGGFLDIAYFSDLDLDPASISTPEDMMVGRLIHRGLLSKDWAGQIQPDLCVDYEIRDLTYTFYLNPEARFHSGRPVEASDVAYSLEQLARAPKFNSFSCFVLEINGAEDFRNGIKSEIAGIYIIDNKTLSITLKRPFPAFEDYLTGPAGYIIPKPGEISYGLSVDGAGMYRIKWIEPTGLALEPDALNGQETYLDSLRFTRFESPDKAELAFELGEVDLLSFLGEPKFSTKGNQQSTDTDAYVILGINNSRGYQAGQDFGKALSFLLDRGSIIRVILGGSAIPPGIGFSDTRPLNIPLYNRPSTDSASYYLNEIFSMRKNLNLYVDSSYPILTNVARFIEGQLQNRGIKITEKKVDLSRQVEARFKDAMDLYLTTYLPASDISDCVFYPLLSDNLSGQTNFLYFGDEATQSFLENLRIETDPDRRLSLASGLAQWVAANPPLLFLYQPTLIVYTKSNISGIIGNKVGYPDLRKAYLK